MLFLRKKKQKNYTYGVSNPLRREASKGEGSKRVGNSNVRFSRFHHICLTRVIQSLRYTFTVVNTSLEFTAIFRGKLLIQQ